MARLGYGRSNRRKPPDSVLEPDQKCDFGVLFGPGRHIELGAEQCKNDKDGSVDSDERLRITDVASGTYDAKFADAMGRVCIVRNVKIEVGAIFSIEEKDLASCVQH